MPAAVAAAMSVVAMDQHPAIAELAALHRALSAEILRLECHVDQVEGSQPRLLVASYLLAAVALRDLLTSVSRRRVNLDAMPSFSQLLLEATLGAYGWAVGQLQDVRHLVTARGRPPFASPQPIAHEELCVFHDLSRVCAAHGGANDRDLAQMLDAIDDAIYRLLETRDRIARVVGPGRA